MVSYERIVLFFPGTCTHLRQQFVQIFSLLPFDQHWTWSFLNFISNNCKTTAALSDPLPFPVENKTGFSGNWRNSCNACHVTLNLHWKGILNYIENDIRTLLSEVWQYIRNYLQLPEVCFIYKHLFCFFQIYTMSRDHMPI